jgi:ankyrin repeat protein
MAINFIRCKWTLSYQFLECLLVILCCCKRGVTNAIKKGGKVNYFHRPEDQKTCLHVAAEAGYLEVCQILIENGALVDAVAITNKETALGLAASYGHERVVKLLLDHKSNINWQNAYGNSPLHEAARHGYLAVATMLMERGANIELLNNKGSHALHLSCYGADKNECPSELTKILIKAGSDVNLADKRGVTPLLAACAAGREDLITMLLDSGANGKIVDGTGMDGLATAIFHKRKISKKLHKLISKDEREVPDSVFGV